MAGLMGMATPGHRTEMQTMADIDLGSFASEFDAEAEEEKKLMLQNGRGVSSGIGGPLRERMIQSGPSSKKVPASAPPPMSKTIASSTSNSARRTPTSSSSATSDEEPASNPSPATPRAKLPSRRRNVIHPNASDIDVTGDDSSHPRNQAGPAGLGGGSNFPQIGNATQEGDSDDLMSQSQVNLGLNSAWHEKDDDLGNVGMRNGNGKGATAALREEEGERPSSRASSARRRGTNASESLRESTSGDKMQAMTLRDQQANYARLETENFNFKELNMQLQHIIENGAAWEELNPMMVIAQLNVNLEAKTKEAFKLAKLTKRQQLAMEQQEEELRKLRAFRDRYGKGGMQGNAADMEAQLRKANERERLERQAMEDLQDELGDLRAEIEELRSRADASTANEELEKLQRQLDDADRAEKRYKEELEEKESLIEDLQAELSALTDERDRLQEDLDSRGLESDKEKNLGPKIEQLETINRSLQDELEHHKSRLHTHVTERSTHVEQITCLRDEVNKLSSAQSDMFRTASRADNLQREAETLDRVLQEREQEIAALKGDIRHLTEEHHQILAEVQQQYAESQASLVDEVKESRAIIQQVQDDFDAKEAELAQVAQELANCENGLQEVEALLEESENAKTQLLAEMQNADVELVERDGIQADLSAEVHARNALEQELDSLKIAEDKAVQEREQAYAEIESLSRKLADLEERHRTDADSKRKALEERDDLSFELRRSKDAREDAVRALKSEMRNEVDQHRRTIAEKEQNNSRLTTDIDSARKRIAQRDRDVADLQDALRNAENNHRQLGDEHTSDKISSEMEAERLRRDLQRSEAELENAQDDLERLEVALRDRESEIQELRSEKRNLEQELTAEGQDRLAVSEKLEQAEKAAKQHEPIIATLRQKVEDLQHCLDQEASSLGNSQRRADSLKKDSMDLLHTVYRRVSNIAGYHDGVAPPAFAALKDRLLQRLHLIGNARADFEKQLRSVGLQLDAKVGAMGRELDAKKRLLDNIELAVQRMANTKLSWKGRLAMKEDELNDARARAKILQSQLTSAKLSTEGDTSKERASLSSRATSAEKRVNLLSNQLTELQTQVADHQKKHSDANSKWEARVHEYEKRLKAANERVKLEKQGGKERAKQLEHTINVLEEQIRSTTVRSDRLQSVWKAASLATRQHDPDAL